jgi:hypothetical protein
LETGIKESNAFYLVPVLWGKWDYIRAITTFYEQHAPQFENTSTPVCFIPFTDQEGNPVYKFGTIDAIFENSKIQ